MMSLDFATFAWTHLGTPPHGMRERRAVRAIDAMLDSAVGPREGGFGDLDVVISGGWPRD